MAEPIVQDFRASDGYKWKYRRIAPTTALRGTITTLHGIQSHGEWYLDSAKWLADRGWDVSLLDRRGSGLNEANRGDAPSFRRLLDDVSEYLSTQSKPRILMGISWGGKLAVALERRHAGLIDRLVLLAPGLRPRVAPPLKTRLRILLARFSSPSKQFPIPLSDPLLFTANPERQKFIENDPRSLRTATARLMFESRRLDVYLHGCPKRITIPTLLLLAGQDRIIDNERTRRYVERFRGPVTTIEYPSSHHTLDFEPDGVPYLLDLANWLDVKT